MAALHKLSVLTFLATIAMGLPACGSGGDNDDARIGFSAGVFSGATQYRLQDAEGERALCDDGLNRLYREDPLGYSINPTGTSDGVTRYSVTKLGKGSPSGEVLSSDTSLQYQELLVSSPLPDAADITCDGNNTVTLSVVDGNTISAEQLLSFICRRDQALATCAFSQRARLLRQ